MAIEISFQIKNNNPEDTVYLSRLHLNHEYTDPFSITPRRSGSFMLSNRFDNEYQQTNFFRYRRSKHSEILNSRDELFDYHDTRLGYDNSYNLTEFNYSNMNYLRSTDLRDLEGYVDLGIYTANHESLGFVLENGAISISPNNLKLFKFRFLIEKKLLNRFRFLQFSNSDIYYGTGNLEQRLLPELYHSSIGRVDIDSISNIKLVINFLIVDSSLNKSYIIRKVWNHSKNSNQN